MGSYPDASRDNEVVKTAWHHYAGHFGEPLEVYSDPAGEYNTAFELLHWNHRTARPHRSQTNGVAERSVRRVTEATRCTLYHARLPVDFWAIAMRTTTSNHNATYKARDDKTPYELVHNTPWPVPILSFGQLVEYQFSKKER